MNSIALGKIVATGALAVTLVTTALPLAASAGEVWNRVENQQDRIAAGVASGQLTWAEYRSDEARLAAIRAQRVADLRANGGRLTAFEHAQLNAELNAESARIYWTKHNERRQF
jgi:hypothetical protein